MDEIIRTKALVYWTYGNWKVCEVTVWHVHYSIDYNRKK